MTCTMPILAIFSGGNRSMRSPMNSIEPSVTSPSSCFNRPDMAFRVVLFPAPLAPSSATMPPSGTSMETPLITRMTSWYFTSMLLILRIDSAVDKAS